MTSAYNESYLSDAMRNLGDMFDYAITDCGYEPDHFYNMFVNSGIARQFGNGNPKYIVGMSGIELAQAVIYKIEGTSTEIKPNNSPNASPEFWAGWSLAQYQWYRSLRFSDMSRYGLKLSVVLAMYHTLHEADITKFYETADEILLKNASQQNTPLQTIRKARGYTQLELSAVSGVSLRMIQLYEQRKSKINRAKAITVKYLADALACDMEDILELQIN